MFKSLITPGITTAIIRGAVGRQVAGWVGHRGAAGNLPHRCRTILHGRHSARCILKTDRWPWPHARGKGWHDRSRRGNRTAPRGSGPALGGRCVRRPGPVGVAFFGGVDSSVLLAAAVRVMGPDMVIAILGVSPSLAADERSAAHEVAAFIGVPVVEVATFEGDRAEYRANGPDRCFHCKDEFDSVAEVAATRSISPKLLLDRADTAAAAAGLSVGASLPATATSARSSGSDRSPA